MELNNTNYHLKIVLPMTKLMRIQLFENFEELPLTGLLQQYLMELISIISCPLLLGRQGGQAQSVPARINITNHHLLCYK